MRVRIHRVPPSGVLEGVDLRPYVFKPGRLYEVDPMVAKVLLSGGYAESHLKADASDLPEQARACAKCGSQMTVIGQSKSPPLVHLQCGRCGYTSVHSLI